jgi:signal transduction histidine kinase
MKWGHQSVSIRWRLLIATMLVLACTLLASGWVLAGLFEQHVMRQFQSSLVQHLDQLTARLDLDSQGRLQLNDQAMTDPRWQQPYSGLYWQLQSRHVTQGEPTDQQRSRSLWDAQLSIILDDIETGALHWHQQTGPKNQALLVVERRIRWETMPQYEIRCLVAEDLATIEQSLVEFNTVLTSSLAFLYGMLILAAWAQVAVALRPLRKLQHAVRAVSNGEQPRLQGAFPREVQTLVQGFNTVLDRNDALIERARLQAGNLAHALKTPLTILEQASHNAEPHAAPEWTDTVREQVGIARKYIDWHLKRARMAATVDRPGQKTALRPLVQGLIRVLERVYHEKYLQWILPPTDPELYVAVEAQDLQEILGNLLDNAGKWATGEVRIAWALDCTHNPSQQVRIEIEDDGPGIEANQLKLALQRGQRLDESTPGSGLGLAIVRDLVQSYGGSLQLGTAKMGGLRAAILVPLSGHPTPNK